MTRVLIVEGAGNLWGSERALLDLLDSLTNIETAVCCPPKTPIEGELKNRNIRVLPYFVYALHEKSRWQRLWAALGVVRACLEFRPDVIYVNQSGSYKIARVAASLRRLPMVAHVRLFEDAAYLARQRPKPRRLRGIIAISDAMEAELRRFAQLKSIPLFRLYDAYAPKSLNAVSSGPAPDATARIACVGRIEPLKGQDLLVNALGLLGSIEGGLQCLMIGTGKEDFVEKLKREASRQNIDGLLQWRGFIRDVVPLLQTCPVLVCPSYRELLGRVILEAWDAGAVPVVFGGSGGAAEVVAAADGGIIYEKQEPRCLADAIQAAIKLDFKEKSRLVHNGRSWMAKNCDARSYGRAMHEIFSAVCAESNTPMARRRLI